MFKEEKKTDKALLVGIQFEGDSPMDVDTLLEELHELVETVGLTVLDKLHVKLRSPNAQFLLGQGKVAEIIEHAKALEADVIVFDNELSAGQQRNWEKESQLVVIDRQEVILDIFAQRAQTREARLQVELAQMEYALPRLKRAWTHLERQRGGGSVQRGAGEQQIEMDKRIIGERIAKLKKELSEVIQHRDLQRKKRSRIPLPTVAIVGYTNAGKSSLLRALTGAQVLVEDKLFATLDPTTRRLELSNGQIILLTDTVGFVRKLPHRLVESFKATLEEAVVADFLIHVVDLSSPDLEHHMQTTLNVMKELGADTKTAITAFNKIDLQDDIALRKKLKLDYPDCCFMSTVTREGLDELVHKIEEHLKNYYEFHELVIPHSRYDIINVLHEMGAVQKEEHLDDGVAIKGNIPVRLIPQIKDFIKK